MGKIVSLLLLFVWIPPAIAQYGLKDQEKKKEGISYLCTGIGESKSDPRNASYPLKIVFATNSSALYSDVTVKIDSEGGKTVFQNFCDGAWLLVQLPPGKYQVTGTDQKGLARSCPVTVGAGQTQCTLRWPD